LRVHLYGACFWGNLSAPDTITQSQSLAGDTPNHSE
jgi:hypothetical protein